MATTKIISRELSACSIHLRKAKYDAAKHFQHSKLGTYHFQNSLPKLPVPKLKVKTFDQNSILQPGSNYNFSKIYQKLFKYYLFILIGSFFSNGVMFVFQILFPFMFYSQKFNKN